MTDKLETIRLDAGRSEMPLADNALSLTPHGKDHVLMGVKP